MEDATLLQEFGSTRSPEAFRRLAEKYRPMILASALRQVRDASAAEDVTQAVLVTLWDKAAELPADVRLGAWLHHVTRCHAVDHRRARAARQKHEHSAAALRSQKRIGSDDPWIRLEEMVDEALDTLRDDDRTLLVSYYLQGQSSEEISSVTGVRPVAIRKRISRALGKLRTTLHGRQLEIELSVLEGLLIDRIAGRLSGSSLPTATVASGNIAAALPVAKIAAALVMAGGTAALIAHKQSVLQRAATPVQPQLIAVKESKAKPLTTITPLIQATVRHNATEVNRLLNAGVSVDEISRDGNNTSALLYAATLPSDSGLAITRLLVEHGADVNMRHGRWGYTAAMVAERFAPNGSISRRSWGRTRRGRSARSNDDDDGGRLGKCSGDSTRSIASGELERITFFAGMFSRIRPAAPRVRAAAVSKSPSHVPRLPPPAKAELRRYRLSRVALRKNHFAFDKYCCNSRCNRSLVTVLSPSIFCN